MAGRALNAVALEGPVPRQRRTIRSWAEPWTYLSPTLVLIALLMLVPLVVGIGFAFQNVQILNPFKRGWVGLAHFQAIVRDAIFWRALTNTLWWTFTSLILQFLLGLGLALLLWRDFKGKRIVQALVFLPWAVPSFLSGLTFAWLFNPVVGPIPHWLHALGLLSAPDNILADPALAMWGPITANVWWGIPFFAITTLAALQSIPNEMYEAASIDGAGVFSRFRHVTLAYLVPTIAITLLLRTIWIANFGDLIVVMTGGGPANATQILPSYIFTMAFRKLDFGYASALSLVLLALLFLYAILILQMRKRLRSAF
ncbi:MAG TPA: sugar ABC transporter permease [Geminicoccus sp.]|jgi:multiple sugar transport system permease protein|uniref:carbohydrate ABC transporter permease n=1 Tax=Geminicoccus sp. TaxID=2024832 RepID=UPI002E349563|nr:sugar ABC transporter permease [Geminicoccus sp.]HEX2526434.1 sugar ABC transporter permease [Geminicoccus sp.]